MQRQLGHEHLMAPAGGHQVNGMCLLARPGRHRLPAAFVVLHRTLAHTARGGCRRRECRISVKGETETALSQSVTVRPALLSELDDIAWLRAEAFYEVIRHSLLSCSLMQSLVKPIRS